MKSSKIILDFYSVTVLITGLLIGLVACAIAINVLGINENSGFFSLFAYLINFLTPILLYNYFVIKKSSGQSLCFDLSIKPTKVYLMIFPMMLGMILIADYICQLIPTEGVFLGDMYKSYTSQLENLSLEPVPLILMTVVCAPIIEEIIFRGIIQTGLINNGIKPKFAIVTTAFIFGAIHIYIWQFVGGFLLSLVMGWVYYKTKSLLMPILLHAFNNAISVISTLALETSDLSEIFKLKNECIFLIGLILFIIPAYLFNRWRNVSNN